MSQTESRRRVVAAGVALTCTLALAGCADLIGSAPEATDVVGDGPAASEPAPPAPVESEPSATPTQGDPGNVDSDADGDVDVAEPEESAPADDREPVTVIPAATMGSDEVVSAGGFVQDAIELGGTCYFTLTQGTEVVTGESAAEPDATTTWCANVELRLPQPGAAWELELRYESPMSVGVGSTTSEGEAS